MPQRSLDAFSGGELCELAELELPPRHVREAEPRPAGSRVHLYVLQGKLIAGPVELSTELGTGDYASFPADVTHVYETGRQPARALLLSHGPS